MKASSKKSHPVAGKSIRRKRLICSFAAADNEGAGHAKFTNELWRWTAQIKACSSEAKKAISLI